MIAKIAIRACYLLFLFLFSTGVKAQLKADFSGTPLSGCPPLLVQFSDSSAGSPTQWRWDLGNGTVSFLQNPSVSYFIPGQYAVKLVIKNALGSADSVTKTKYVTVFAKPSVEFIGNVTGGCYPLTVNFTDQSIAQSGNISNWEWDYGDGTGSNENDSLHVNTPTPTHIYNAAGNFNVTLRVTNSLGCVATNSKTSYIKILGGVNAGFTNTTPVICGLPATINFSNTSTGSGSLTYQWNFGDNSAISNEDAPSHTYTTAGAFKVTLIATNSVGCSDTTEKIVNISLNNVKAAFNSADNACFGTPFNLNITSASFPTSVLWDFGDNTTSTDMNFNKVYAAEGTYKIKLIANFGGCADSTSKDVTVLAKPKAIFNIPGKSTSCKAPLTVEFNNQSTNGDMYRWDFGDGTTSNQFSPTHTYTKAGLFSVNLVVTNASGCADSVKINNAVQIVMPQLALLGLPDSSCAPYTKSFSYNAQEIDIWSDFNWDFGDGTTSTESSPVHTYDSVGIYTVKLSAKTFDGCYDTAVFANAIKLTVKPTANFSGDREACAIVPIQFTDLSTGNINRWLWFFGDGATSIEQNPKHQYADTGYFDVKLAIWNGGCPDTVRFNKYVYIKAPIAKFTTVPNCTKSRERVFTDKSIGADAWSWDFGDGATSTDSSAVHTYAADGIYTVTQTVFNHTTGCEYSYERDVQIISTKPDFYASDTVICRNSTVTFTVPPANRVFVVGYMWDFGDNTGGFLGNGPQITHTYTRSGIYNVRLIITNTLGCSDTLIKTQYITVNGPTAKFTPSISAGCLQTTVHFADNSTSDGTHPIENWIWNYGIDKIDTLTTGPTQYTYNVAGVYTAHLTVIDQVGCRDSFSLPSPVIISQPKAAFTSVDTLSCPGKPIKFTNQSVGSSLTYSWNFGDLKTSTNADPSHLYGTDGDYSVKLSVKDIYGCKDSITKPNFVKIVMPVAQFSMSDSVSTCPPLMVYFKDTSNVGISRKWDFGDNTFSTLSNPSHFYIYPGTYIVRLTITGPGGCIDYKEKSIVIRGPRGSFTYTPLTGCQDLKIDFIAKTLDKASFIWDYSDGTTVPTTDSFMTHTYTHFGEYIPRLILVDPQGCQVPIAGLDTIKVSGALAKFDFVNKVTCDSGFIAFSDSSDSYDKIVQYTWDLGDGLFSTDQNATHQYTRPGTYFPKLTVTTENGCKDSTVTPFPIKIVASPKVDITEYNNGCIPLVTGFTGALLAADTSALSWKWNFGNGITADVQNPLKQTYSNAGNYTVSLNVTNSSGCKTTIIKTVEAYPIPKVNAGEDGWVCLGKKYPLNATGASTYSWNYNKTLSCLNCANPLATPLDETRYIVTGTSEHGCSATDEVVLKVQNPFTMTYSQTDTLCKGSSTELSANGADSYLWSPTAGLRNVTNAKVIATPDTTTIYRVIGTDTRGCFHDTGFVKIKVYPIPTVDAGEDKMVNIGRSITLAPKVSRDVTEVIWSPLTGAISSSNDLPNLTIKPKTTTQYNIEVRNPGGCKASDNVTVFVICNGANIFMPNTFSPNGDGTNDLYYPRGSGIFKIKNLRIFNRWGQIVFEKSNYQANDASSAWDGTYKGAKLTPDVFVYTLDVQCENNEILTFNGNIALIQ